MIHVDGNLSIPAIRIFRMNSLHRCVNNNASGLAASGLCPWIQRLPFTICLLTMNLVPAAFSPDQPRFRKARRFRFRFRLYSLVDEFNNELVVCFNGTVNRFWRSWGNLRNSWERNNKVAQISIFIPWETSRGLLVAIRSEFFGNLESEIDFA